MPNQTDVDEKLLELFKDILLNNAKLVKTLDGSDILPGTQSDIEKHIALIHSELKPRFVGKQLFVYEEGRARRTFDAEFQRLWVKAEILHRRQLLHKLGSGAETLISTNKTVDADFSRVAAMLVNQIIAPLLDELDWPGDDFYLMIDQMLKTVPEDAAIEAIAGSGTPPQSRFAIYGMFGLLIQAGRYKQRNRMNEAYSCLLDASNLIGLSEGSRYAFTYAPPVVVKKKAQESARKSHAKTAEQKRRVVQLYYQLSPSGTDPNKPGRWKSAKMAAKDIESHMARDAYKSGAKKTPISYRLILEVCQNLQKLTKLGVRLDMTTEPSNDEPDTGPSANN